MKIFRSCYEAAADTTTGLVTWRRIALPVAGGVGDQDEREMQALEVIADEQNRLAVEAVHRERVRRRKRKLDREAKRRGR